MLKTKSKQRAFMANLAREIGISHATLTRIMQGNRKMGLEVAETIADALGMKIICIPIEKGSK